MSDFTNFMQQQITQKMLGWEVDTNEGIYFVPEDVLHVPGYLVPGQSIQENDIVFDSLAEHVQDYCASGIRSIEICKGYFARLSAPGYMDCTDWVCCKTVKEAREYLRSI